MRRHERVLGVQQLKGGEWQISSENDDIVCEHVANEAGTYARQIGEWVGQDLPITDITHHYLATDTVQVLTRQGRALSSPISRRSSPPPTRS